MSDSGVGRSARTFIILGVILTALIAFLFYSRTNWLYYAYYDSLSSKTGVILLAVIAGAVSFFSPCAFPLLSGFVSYYFTLEKHGSAVNEKPVRAAISLGLVLASGILVLYIFIGLIVSFLVTFIVSKAVAYSYVILMQPLVGLLLMVSGLALFMNRSLGLPFLDTVMGNIVGNKVSEAGNPGEGSGRKVFLYGLGYGAATGGCTAPIFISMMVYASAFGGISSAVLAFIIYSAMMFITMTAVAVLVALSKDVLLSRFKASTEGVKRFSGIVMAIVGLYLIIVYVDWALLGNTPIM